METVMISLMLKDIAQKQDLCVQRDATLKQLIEQMNLNREGVVVVMDGMRPVGILTERDIVEILYGECNLDEKAEIFAKKSLICTRGDRTVGYALNLMLENNIRRVIVTDDSGNFLGIVTQHDLLKYLEEDFYRSAIKVKHILEKLGYLISVAPEDTMKDVLKKMVENKISAVVVLQNDKAAGIITEKDILKLTTKNISLDNPVSQHMSSPVITASLEDSLVSIVKVMNEKAIRRVIIVDSGGIAINIVTVRDVMRNLEGDYSKFLERKLKSAKDVLNMLPEMMIEVTDTGKEQLVIWANEKVLNTFGKRILDRPVWHFIPPEVWEKIYNTIHKFNRIENIKIKKGESILELSGFFIPTEGNIEKGRYQLIIRDITEDVKLSTVDALTSIYNRRFVNEFLLKEIERSRRLKRGFSVLMCDIDCFKEINDTYGHASGDMVLRSFARTISGALRSLDVIGRYGGDEFVVILPETSHENAVMIMNRLVGLVDKMVIPGVSEQMKIQVSFGVATFPDDGYSSDDLLVAADDRLYKEKRKRKSAAAG